MELEILNKLYLELSQVATVMNDRERKLYHIVDAVTCLVNATYWHALEEEEKYLEKILKREGYLKDNED